VVNNQDFTGHPFHLVRPSFSYSNHFSSRIANANT
jgi:hypothetical protein